MNKQKTDWETRFNKKFGVSDDWDNSLCQQVPSGGWINSNVEAKSFINQLLNSQREEIISEIEGIVGEDEFVKERWLSGSEEIPKEVFRNQLRKEIRERLKQITNLKENKRI